MFLLPVIEAVICPLNWIWGFILFISALSYVSQLAFHLQTSELCKSSDESQWLYLSTLKSTALFGFLRI